MRWLIALILLATPATAVECRNIAHEGKGYAACKVDVHAEELRLFLNDPATSKPLASFQNVDMLLEGEGLRLGFAMNAGMYHQDRQPVGHYVEDGVETAPVISSKGPGNFGLLPNGVFCIGNGWAQVYETFRYLREEPDCLFASQSGPMLVIDAELHPRFLPDSDSRHFRNGVGTTADGRTAWFVISNEPVTFHNFGSLFRDALKVPQALYFDGKISRLYAPGLGRHDGGFPMGPIVGVVSEAPE